MKTTIKILSTVVGSIVLLLYGGWIFQTLWGWFVATTFGIQTLSLPQAIGLSIFAGLITWKLPPKEDTNQTFTEVFVRASVIPIISWTVLLLSGYIVTFFI